MDKRTISILKFIRKESKKNGYVTLEAIEKKFPEPLQSLSVLYYDKSFIVYSGTGPKGGILPNSQLSLTMEGTAYLEQNGFFRPYALQDFIMDGVKILLGAAVGHLITKYW